MIVITKYFLVICFWLRFFITKRFPDFKESEGKGKREKMTFLGGKEGKATFRCLQILVTSINHTQNIGENFPGDFDGDFFSFRHIHTYIHAGDNENKKANLNLVVFLKPRTPNPPKQG